MKKERKMIILNVWGYINNILAGMYFAIGILFFNMSYGITGIDMATRMASIALGSICIIIGMWALGKTRVIKEEYEEKALEVIKCKKNK